MKLKQENTNPFLYIMLYNPTLADPQLNKQDLSAVIFKMLSKREIHYTFTFAYSGGLIKSKKLY